MIKRIYVDNFRCLVNFDLSFDKINIFLGENGSGKSSVFDVLRKVQALIVDEDKADQVFCPSDITRWQNKLTQQFELDVEGNGGVYHYELNVEHELNEREVRVQREELRLDDRALFHYEAGTVQLYHDDFSEGPEYPFDWSRSGLGSLMPRPDNTRLTWFKERLAKVIAVRANPFAMAAGSDRESHMLACDKGNFTSWYRHLSQAQQGEVLELTMKLREIIDGFHACRLVRAGEPHRLLEVGFTSPEAPNAPTYYRFDELSDGQRLLIAFHALLCCTKQHDYTLCIDEPANFLALPEIEPWLKDLYDMCCDGPTQALLISHHPKPVNYLVAANSGYWFSRPPNGPVRVERIDPDEETGLPFSELMARGWVNGQA